jgi:hypothetical protein
MVLDGFLLAGINQPDQHIGVTVLLALKPRPTLHRALSEDNEAFKRPTLEILRPFVGFWKTLSGNPGAVALPVIP